MLLPAAGEELLLSYGPLGDSELLRMYGFVEQHPDGFANPHSKVLITYNELLVACRTSVSEGAAALAAPLADPYPSNTTATVGALIPSRMGCLLWRTALSTQMASRHTLGGS